MPRYSYNNIIIIVTNFIILEFLSPLIEHPGALQLTILSFFDTSQNKSVTKMKLVKKVKSGFLRNFLNLDFKSGLSSNILSNTYVI